MRGLLFRDLRRSAVRNSWDPAYIKRSPWASPATRRSAYFSIIESSRINDVRLAVERTEAMNRTAAAWTVLRPGPPSRTTR